MQGLLAKFVLPVLFVTSSAKIELNGNGYTQVVVSISADVEEDRTLLSRLENILTDASASLFRATKNQVYFKEFYIVLPDNWKGNVTNVTATASDAVLEHSDIIIDRPNQAHGHTPYVLQYAECGKPGQYLHLTPGYILEDKVRRRYGAPGKVITHEWAHLRWGVFDEYPINPDKQFYRHGNQWYPTRCSVDVQGELRSQNEDEECIFDWQTGRQLWLCAGQDGHRLVAHVRTVPGECRSQAEGFCDEETKAPKHLRHNRLAPNRHNRLCGYLSVWEVMRKHPDFKKMPENSTLPDTTDTRPKFRYVQEQPKKRVLVLDTSGSMQGVSIVVMKQAASNFILNSAETGSQLAIVQFNDHATQLFPLTKVRSLSDRRRLIAGINTLAAGGGTSIGAGLRSALAVLKQGGYATGGTIILITDGQETNAPMMAAVKPEIKTQGVIVHVFSFGNNADWKIKQLASETGGQVVFYKQNSQSTALLDGMAATVTTQGSMMRRKDVFVSILTDAKVVTVGRPLMGTFFIDSTIGRQTSLTFSFSSAIAVTIHSPSGPYTNTTVDDYTGSANIRKILLGDNLEPGRWTYTVTTTAASSSITVKIQSMPRQSGTQVVQIHSWISQHEDITFDPKKMFGVYAEVKRGKTPVMGATVIATVDSSGGSSKKLQLFDHGTGSDILPGDGIYSSYILATDMAADGRYNIKINVLGSKNSTKVVVGAGGQAGSSGANFPGMAAWRHNLTTEALEDFQRVTTAGEFRVTGYSQAPIVGDVIAPSRITDFHAKTFDPKHLNATLEWTAVGDDMDRGQASRYVIFMSQNLTTALHNSSSVDQVQDGQVIVGNLSTPSAPGQHEEVVISVRNLGPNETLYLVITAVDEVGNTGQVSNVVTLSPAGNLSIPVVTQPDSKDKDKGTTDKDNGTTDKGNGTTDKGNGSGKKEPSKDKDSGISTTYLAIGIAGACFMVVIVVVIVLVVRAKKRKERVGVSEEGN